MTFNSRVPTLTSEVSRLHLPHSPQPRYDRNTDLTLKMHAAAHPSLEHHKKHFAFSQAERGTKCPGISVGVGEGRGASVHPFHDL